MSSCGELEALVDLRHRVRGEVVLEAAEMELEHGRQRLEEHALLRVLLPKAVRVVLVLAVEDLLLDVLVERGVEILAALDRHLQVVILLVAQRFVIDVDAIHVVCEFAAEEMLHRPLDRGALHLLLELLDEHPVELLHVVLHERVVRVPPEGLGELLRGDGRVGVLQLVEDALQRQRDGRLGVLAVGRVHVVHGLAEVRYVRERLQQRVHVARRALVLEANVAGLALGVPIPPIDLRLDAHARRDDQLVVVDEAGARVA